MTNTDALGRLIKPGDVCGFASRRGSQTYLDIIIIREVRPEGPQGSGGIKADKLVKEWKRATATTLAGWTVKLVPTHTILVSAHLIIIGLTEREAIERMRIRKER